MTPAARTSADEKGMKSWTCPGCGYDLTGLPRRVCPECGRAFTAEELSRRRTRRAALRRWALQALLFAIVMYAPYSWLLFIDYPWSDYRWLWIRLWPGLPAIMPCHRLFDGSGMLEYPMMYAISLGALAGLSFLASRRWWLAAMLLTVVAGYSIASGIGTYHAFLM